MSGWKDGYNTKAALTMQIRKIVAKAHNISSTDILVNWTSQWRIVTFPTGLIEKVGTIVLRASGFETRKYCVSQKKNHMWIMV